MVEGGLAVGPGLLPMLLPGLVAAAIGYVLFVGLGDWSGLDATALSVPGLPAYDGTRVADLLSRSSSGSSRRCSSPRVRRGGDGPGRAAARRAAGDAARRRPGRRAARTAHRVARRRLGRDALLRPVRGAGDHRRGLGRRSCCSCSPTKAIAYAICLGCGFRGGPVFPAIFLGVGVATIPVIVFDMSPTAAVAIGAGAGMAAGTRLIFASLLFAGLLVGRRPRRDPRHGARDRRRVAHGHGHR